MSIQQAIYTSCQVGIEKDTSGFQLYSYSNGMKQIMNETKVGTMFEYEPPEGTEEKKAPQKFAYRMIEEEKQWAAFALNSYIGIEQYEESSRYGNIHSHVLVAENEEITDYPCYYYKSPIFREALSKEEAMSRRRPEFLSEIKLLEKGNVVSIQKVCSFLSEQRRIDTLKVMIHCVLSYEEDGRKRKVVICDEPESIIMWISAITLALPKIAAKQISFSTYEYDPFSSDYRICGATKEGTRYRREEATWREQVFLFDLEQGIVPEIQGEEAFDAFIEEGYQNNYESIAAFLEFLDKTSYEQCDEIILTAFEVFRFLEGETLLGSVGEERQEKILYFLHTYCTGGQRAKFQEVIVNQLMREFEGESETKERFSELYALGRSYFESMHKKIVSYLLEESTTVFWLNLISKMQEEWKWHEIFSLLRRHIQEEHTSADCMKNNQMEGKIVEALVIWAATRKQNKTAFVMQLVNRFYDEFEQEVRYCIRFTILVDYTLKNRVGIHTLPAFVWKEYYKRFYMLGKHQQYIAFRELLLQRKMKNIIAYFDYSFERYPDFQQWFLEVQEFLQSFYAREKEEKEPYLDLCYEKAKKDPNHMFQNCYAIFLYANSIKLSPPYINRILDTISNEVPLIVEEKADKEKIQQLYYYQVSHKNGRVENRIAMAYRLCELKELAKEQQENMELETYAGVIAINKISDFELTRYLKEVGKCIGEIILKNGQVNLLTKFYRMTEEQQFVLSQRAMEELLLQGKKTKDYLPFIKTALYLSKQNEVYSDYTAAILQKYKFTKKEMDTILKSVRKKQKVEAEVELYLEELAKREAFSGKSLWNPMKIFRRGHDKLE